MKDYDIPTFNVGCWAPSENTECFCQIEHQKLKQVKSKVVVKILDFLSKMAKFSTHFLAS